MNQNLIFYFAGCYGTFVEWVCNYLLGNTDIIKFNPNGNSHQFSGNLLFPKDRLFEHIQSEKINQFSRCSSPFLFAFDKTDNYARMLQRDVDFLKIHFKKVLYITFDHESLLFYENNRLDKIPSMISNNIEKIRSEIDFETLSPEFKTNIQRWGKESIQDFDIWELRELLAMNWFEKKAEQISAFKTLSLDNKDVEFVSISSLRDDFIGTIINIAEFFDIKPTESDITNLKKIYLDWVILQTNIDKDARCDEIIKNIISGKHDDWSNDRLSLIDEAYIQKRLLENKIEIRCFNLNVFPTNSTDLRELLNFVG
jgi:hypothetical protein